MFGYWFVPVAALHSFSLSSLSLVSSQVSQKCSSFAHIFHLHHPCPFICKASAKSVHLVYCLLLVSQVMKTLSSFNLAAWMPILPFRWNPVHWGNQERGKNSSPYHMRNQNKIKNLKNDLDDPCSLIHSCFQEQGQFILSLSELLTISASHYGGKHL